MHAHYVGELIKNTNYIISSLLFTITLFNKVFAESNKKYMNG